MSPALIPLIGLSTYRQQAKWASWDREAAILSTSYVDCVATAGGRPIMVPPAEGPGVAEGSASAVAQRLDGLVLVGGADLEPSRYRAERHGSTGETHPWRDENEITLLAAFLELRKPVLGICRGAQILNTLLGGTLHQHVPHLVGHTRHQPGPGMFGETQVGAEPGSLVAKAMGESFTVSCCHHQSIDVPGQGLTVTARSADGVTEAVESDDGFVLGVQWHPEQIGDTRLFEELVRAC